MYMEICFWYRKVKEMSNGEIYEWLRHIIANIRAITDVINASPKKIRADLRAFAVMLLYILTEGGKNGD